MNFKRHRAWPGLLALLCILTGLLASVPLPGIEGKAYAAAGPDLAILSITWSPQTPAIGNQVSITVSVKNQGDAPAGTSRALLFIDDDLTGSTFLSQISSGSTLSYIFYWKATAGDHILKVVIDSEDSVIETDESNNDKFYAFSVLAPDLFIENLAWTPENPSAGDTVTYAITVKNSGNKIATASKVGFFIDGRLWSNRDIVALDIGQETIINYSIAAATGLHKIEAFADVLNQVKESDETNNTKSGTTISAVPDLVIQAITYTPENRAESSNITASVTVQNIGSGDAGFSSLVFYIDDIYQTSTIVDSLNAGSSSTKTFSCAVNANEHLLRAIIDSSALVTEIDETNNAMTATVSAIAPDLIIQSITWSPAQPLIAHMTHFTVTVKNRGARQSSTCDLSFYIADLNIYHARIIPLDSGATFSVSFPWVTQSASLSLLAVIDEDNLLRESNETNNTATASVGLTVAAPNTDLFIQSFTCTPSTPSPGDDVVVTTVVKNQGPGAAGPSHIACYIDGELLGFVYVPELTSGDSIEKSITWPAVSGQHQVKTVLDCNNSVSETNELNNESATYIIATAPDLVIEKLEWTPLNPSQGRDVVFSLTITNLGNRASGKCYITYYVNDVERGTHYLDGIEPDASVIRDFSWNMQSASDTFRAAIDEAGVVLESNENNNIKSVVIPAPDLTIVSIACVDDYPLADTALTFTVIIMNTGRSAASGVQAVSYIDGTPLAVINPGTIAAGGIAESVITWTAVPGKHVLRIIADEADAITENNELDNTQEVIIFVPLPSTMDGNEPQSGEENPAETVPVTTSTSAEPTETAAPAEIPPEILETIPMGNEEEPESDISGNLSAAPAAESPDGIKGLLTNKWLLIGVAAIGISAIGALLLLRKRSGQPKAEKPPKPPKAPKLPKPAKPAKKAPAPVKTGDTLSGKPAVIIPPGKPGTPVKAIIPPDARPGATPLPKPPAQPPAPPPVQPPPAA